MPESLQNGSTIVTRRTSRVVLLWLFATPLAADWPRFLGPHQNGTIRDDQLIEGWMDRGLEVVWSREVGEGYSGLTIADDRVFTLDADGRSEYIFASDTATGEEVWRLRLGREPHDWYGGLGPRVTPTVAGDRLVLMTGEGDLVAVSRDSGEVLWRQPVQNSMAARFPAEGYSAAALIEGNRIFLPIGGSDGRALAAFELSSGKLIWAVEDDRAAYSSPVSAHFGGQRQILFLMASKLFAVRPDNGTLLWSFDWDTFDGVNAASPLIIEDNLVFLSAGYDQGAAMLRIDSANGDLEAQPVWKSRVMRNHFNNSVFHGGVLYGFDESNLTAVDAKDGSRLWRNRGLGKGSLLLVSDHLVVLGEQGELILARPDRERLDEIDRMQPIEGRSWTPPAVAGGRLFLRNRQLMVCLGPVEE